MFRFGIEKEGMTVLEVDQTIEKPLLFEFLFDLDWREIDRLIAEAEGSPVDHHLFFENSLKRYYRL
jgi:hypothetical protein